MHAVVTVIDDYGYTIAKNIVISPVVKFITKDNGDLVEDAEFKFSTLDIPTNARLKKKDRHG